MKKSKLTGKLSLNKETVARLSDNQMNDAKGGNKPGFLSIGGTCKKYRYKLCCANTTTYE